MRGGNTGKFPPLSLWLFWFIVIYFNTIFIPLPEIGVIFVATNNDNSKKQYDNSDSDENEYIFRASITKNGVTYYAKDYGKKAFKIKVN